VKRSSALAASSEDDAETTRVPDTSGDDSGWMLKSWHVLPRSDLGLAEVRKVKCTTSLGSSCLMFSASSPVH
jgi:hypothetical protein